jgi:hypothetical protein
MFLPWWIELGSPIEKTCVGRQRNEDAVFDQAEGEGSKTAISKQVPLFRGGFRGCQTLLSFGDQETDKP